MACVCSPFECVPRKLLSTSFDKGGRTEEGEEEELSSPPSQEVSSDSLGVLLVVEGHSRGRQLLHQNLKGRHAWVICSVLGLVQVAELSHGTDVDIVAEVSEHGRGDTPLATADSLRVELGLSPIEGVLRALGVDNLVEAGKHVAARDVLERGA